VIGWFLNLQGGAPSPLLLAYYGPVARRLARVQRQHGRLEGQPFGDVLAAEQVLLQLQNLLSIPAFTRRLAREVAPAWLVLRRRLDF
jgi:hypothetical protein